MGVKDMDPLGRSTRQNRNVSFAETRDLVTIRQELQTAYIVTSSGQSVG